MTALGKSSPRDKRSETCPHPHNWFICQCGCQFGNWESFQFRAYCPDCGEVCEATDNPAREAWFAEREAA